MIPAPFDYHAPGSLDEAIALLRSTATRPRCSRAAEPAAADEAAARLPRAPRRHQRIPGLDYIKEEGGDLRIGGRTRESALERSDVIKTKYPILPTPCR